MKITEIAFSCYPVTDIEQSRAFYEGALGLAATQEADLGEQGHWIEYDIGAGTLVIGRAPNWSPSPDGCAVALEVEDFDQAVASIISADVPIKLWPFETPFCHMVMIYDPDGNTIIIHKRKSEEE